MTTKDRIIEQLKAGPKSLVALADAAHTGRRNAYRLVKELHDAKDIRIARWDHSHRGPYFPIYAWGPGTDTPRPVRQTSADRCLQYRHRLHEKYGEHYGKVHAAQKKRIPGRQVVVDGQVVYQQ